jgi:hypothetical protein
VAFWVLAPFSLASFRNRIECGKGSCPLFTQLVRKRAGFRLVIRPAESGCNHAPEAGVVYARIYDNSEQPNSACGR